MKTAIPKPVWVRRVLVRCLERMRKAPLVSTAPEPPRQPAGFKPKRSKRVFFEMP
jgi:hypothetical protein